MIDRIRQTRFALAMSQLAAQANEWLAPAFLRQRTLGVAVAFSFLAALYWGLIASDRYVSEAHVIVQRTDLGATGAFDFATLLGNVGGGSNSDQLLLRDHLLSVDMLKKLDEKLDLRSHYSDWHRDPLSRMWSRRRPMEDFHRYYLSRVTVDYDTFSGVLIVKAEAFDAATAHGIATMLVSEGERYMNAMAHRLAEDQVSFLEKQVAEMGERALQARHALLAFQNQKGMASPQVAAENVTAIVSRLEGELASLQTRRAAMLGYLMPDSASVVDVDLQIAAIEKQLAKQNARLASPAGKSLNQTVEEYQRLQLAAEFAQDVYKTGLVALEKGRIEATRTLKKLSVLQSPTMPEYPMQPRRIYNTVVSILIALLCAGTIHLVAAVIRDHKD